LFSFLEDLSPSSVCTCMLWMYVCTWVSILEGDSRLPIPISNHA
jgi:hypothetical protein